MQHFQLMAKLASNLATVPAQILEHGYDYKAFGSWWTTVQRSGNVFRIVFDGKERALRLECATLSGRTDSWEVVCSWPAGD